MKFPPFYVWLVPPTLGLLVGWQFKSSLPQDQSEAPSEQDLSFRSSRPDATVREALPADAAIDPLTIPLGRSYERMAVSLLDAKAEDFPSLYKEFKNRPHRSFQLNRLFFLHWTRVDPEGAISAARGSDDLRTAYRMWACHEPGKALATALEILIPDGRLGFQLGNVPPGGQRLTPSTVL